MNYRNCALIVVLLGGAVAAMAADRPRSRDGAAEIMNSIKNVEWEEVDFDSLSLLERCRTLMMLNHALGEVGDAALTEHELMSVFVEQVNLSEELASQPPIAAESTRSFEDCRKIAAALLSGPMADTRYASALAEFDQDNLESQERLYDKTCRRKFDEFSGPVREVRRVAAFMKSKGVIKDYMDWARMVSEQRQLEYEQEMQDRRARAAEKDREEDEARSAHAAEMEEQRREHADSLRAQQALYAAQMATAAASAPKVVVVDDDDDDQWYLGWYQQDVADPRDQTWHRDKKYKSRSRK